MNHNMNDPRSAWRRLASAARQVRDERETSAPYGFATRVAARAMSAPSLTGALLEKFALRGLLAACACSAAAAVFGYAAIMPDPEEELLTTDSVAEVLAQS